MLLQFVTSYFTAFSKPQNSSSFTVPETFITAGFTKAHYPLINSWIQFIYWHNIWYKITLPSRPISHNLHLPFRCVIGYIFHLFLSSYLPPSYSSRFYRLYHIWWNYETFVGPFYPFSSYFPWFRFKYSAGHFLPLTLNKPSIPMLK
jgi:hypothetical protein